MLAVNSSNCEQLLEVQQMSHVIEWKSNTPHQRVVPIQPIGKNQPQDNHAHLKTNIWRLAQISKHRGQTMYLLSSTIFIKNSLQEMSFIKDSIFKYLRLPLPLHQLFFVQHGDGQSGNLIFETMGAPKGQQYKIKQLLQHYFIAMEVSQQWKQELLLQFESCSSGNIIRDIYNIFKKQYNLSRSFPSFGLRTVHIEAQSSCGINFNAQNGPQFRGRLCAANYYNVFPGEKNRMKRLAIELQKQKPMACEIWLSNEDNYCPETGRVGGNEKTKVRGIMYDFPNGVKTRMDSF